MSESIERALSYIEDDSNQVSQEYKRQFALWVSQIIDERVALDLEEDRVSLETVDFTVRTALRNAKDSSNPVRSVDDEIKEFATYIKRGDFDSYDIIFPLNMSDVDELPRSFEIGGHKVEFIPSDKWESEFKEPASEMVLGGGRDEMLFEFFKDSENGWWTDYLTFWKIECESNDAKYAMDMALDIIVLLLAKINYSYHVWRFPPVRARGPFPRTRWSRLRKPFLLLAFQEEIEGYNIIDVERRRPEVFEWHDDDFTSRFNRLPNFSFEEDDIGELLINALLAYQRGITESDEQQSFFAFWRGVEKLAQQERNQSVETAVKRGIFALEHLEPDAYDPVLDSVENKIHELRNEITHEGVHISVPEVHREYLKLIFDGLFELYLEYSSDFNDKDLARDFFKYNMKSDSTKRRIMTALKLGEKSSGHNS
jgi:hypothetical protein